MPLGPVLGLDDLDRQAAVEDVRLVVEHERSRPLAPEDVEAAVQEHAVELERERPLDPRALERRDARGERRARSSRARASSTRSSSAR